MLRIGFCGIGFMGAPMVEHLLVAGHEVYIWNRTADKCTPLQQSGATVSASPRELAAVCEMVCLCLLDSQAVEEVVFGQEGIAQAAPVRWLVDHSSISPASTRLFAQRLAEAKGTSWIDAPISGGVPGAKAGTLAIMAGGSPEALEEVRPVLQAYATRITHMGPSGSGQITKLCNQIMVASGVVAVAEAISLAENSGIAADRLPEALSGGMADSRLFQIFAQRMLHPSEEKTGALATMLKDIDTVAALGVETSTTLPITATVQKMMRLGLIDAPPDTDLWEVIKAYQTMRDLSIG